MLKKLILLGVVCTVINLRADDKDTIRTYQVPSITVTSTKAKERQSPVPFSEITEADIKKTTSNIDLPNLLQSMPSIYTFTENGNGVGYTNLRLRGFDQRRISVLVNGIPQNDPEDHNVYFINLSDLQESLGEVQVQRGAGLANYGAAAIAGSINLTTSAFINNPGIRLYAGNGFQEFSGSDIVKSNTNKLKLEYSSGLVNEKYAFYGKMSQINSEGYRDQSFAYLNSYFLSAIRFDEKLKTQVNIYGSSQRDGLSYIGLPKDYITDPVKRRENYSYWEHGADGREFDWGATTRAQEIEEFSSPHIELLNDWYITDNLTFKSSLYYFEGNGYFDYSGAGYTDSSSYGFDKVYPGAFSPGNPLIRAWVGNKQGGWIPRLVWETEGNILTTGAEIRIHQSDHWGKLQFAENLPEGYDPDYKFYEYDGFRDIFSAFARNQYQINEDLMVSGEAQLVYHSYRIANDKFAGIVNQYPNADGVATSGSNDLFNVEYLFLNPRVGVNWNYSPEQNVYLSAAYTQREPRMKNLYNASEAWSGARPQFRRVPIGNETLGYDFSSPLVTPEKMLNIETGWNYISETYNLSGNIYVMDLRDELVKSGQLDQFGAPIDGNAEQTLHYGIELEAGIKAFDNSNGRLDLYANGTFSQNKIVTYNFALKDGTTIALDGNRIAGFPDIMSAFTLNYKISEFNFLLSANYVGSFMTDNFGDLLTTDTRIKTNLGGGYYADNQVDSYYFMNANLSYNFTDFMGTQGIRVHLQINNLTNNLYAAAGEGGQFFGGAERNFFIGAELSF
ncbi:MAG: TonB-dependent receptor [Candidatus Kapaibacterium sp.]